ncbi:hypothetical protein RND81_07G200500 [Saponaria officinalis]|uniref:Response regulatory domain-containing protein n=1 Tax=Saponaria officinalis TaxID=3572 RepID=A0AAW1JQH7_SAPOF
MIMENGFSSSPRNNEGLFPAGLRVLVVDDDPTWLKILEKMLKKCSYDVTTCGLAREALRLLRDRKDGFDIVISDVNMPDMDGFKLLEHVGLEMDLPVIMMSVDGETRRVMKGVQHGACDYLLKPIRMKELKNIWQHVVRKRLNEVRDIEFIDDRDHPNDGYYGGDPTLLKKRKDVENEKESSDPSSSKKARVVWTIELHQKFVKAVNQIGIDSDKVGPKKILDLMNVPWLTRENVASHLQKYRLYLSRIGKGDDNMESSFGATTKNTDFSPKESGGSISHQNSSYALHSDVTSNPMMPLQSSECKPIDRKLKNKTEHKKPFNNENSDPQRANSKAGLTQTFQTTTQYTSFDSPVSGPWQFKPELKPQPKSKNCFDQPVVPILQQQIQTDLLEHAPQINPGLFIDESDRFKLIDVKPPIPKQTGNSVSNPDGLGCIFDVPLDVKNKNKSFKKQDPLQEPIFSLHSETNPKEPQAGVMGHISVNCSETDSKTQAVETEPAFGLVSEDLMFRWLQGGDNSSLGFGIDDMGFSDSNFVDQETFPPYAPKFGLEYEYPFDWVEYPVVDQGLLFS